MTECHCISVTIPVDCFTVCVVVDDRMSLYFSNYTNQTLNANPQYQLSPNDSFLGSPYPIGLDPVSIVNIEIIDFSF